MADNDNAVAAEWHEKRRQYKETCLKNMSGLNADQLKTIEDAVRVLNGVLQSIHDCQDLWMSEIREMDNVYWRLQNNFPKAEELDEE